MGGNPRLHSPAITSSPLAGPPNSPNGQDSGRNLVRYSGVAPAPHPAVLTLVVNTLGSRLRPAWQAIPGRQL